MLSASWSKNSIQHEALVLIKFTAKLFMRILLIMTALTLLSCTESESTNQVSGDEFVPIEAPPKGQGFQLSMEYEVPPYTEAWICDVYPMPNTEFANVNLVKVQQTPGTHHTTLSTLGLTGGSGLEYGRFDCADVYGDSSLMQDQIMFYGNQGDAEHEMQLPKGIAATLPPALDVIHEMHFVNVTDKPVKLYSYINAWTIPGDEVISGIWGGSVRDEHINIPAKSEHSEWSRCVMNEDVEILFVASHTHALGTKFEVALFDGETTGDVFYTNTDWQTPRIIQYEEPIVVPKGQGFEWRCTWKNPRDEIINYGLNSTDEMCNLAIVHTPFSISARCEVVETSDGVLWTPNTSE
ncbi:MAG TPA: hypothetical protein EYN66_22965 [Myxococcales bacterium]|nr:hypothetical protein [Myxococcales bacterium]